ncbi:HNH endonuclease signature motif containing protein, partial [Mycobacterium tuberculosis]|uniref:HNH endonuclease signature motif containing protein n=1 Tax=Mycobacterium tuberculosis TaxID=1773 RepID=UPI001BE3DEE5
MTPSFPRTGVSGHAGAVQIPYAAGGPTHASNLKCYCRTHHLVKTFWGWRDQQLPDGTLIL